MADGTHRFWTPRPQRGYLPNVNLPQKSLKNNKVVQILYILEVFTIVVGL